MKTKISKRLVTAVIFIMVCVTAVAQTQSDSLDRDSRSSCQSTWTEYNNFTEASSIVRSNHLYRVVYVKDYMTNRHTFFVKQRSSSTETAFYTFFCSPSSPGALGASVIINDMRLYGDTCYFCGKVILMKYEFYGGDLVRKTYGFVGFFSITKILNGTGSVYYDTLPEMTQLTRLAISKPDAWTTLISAIGTQRPNRLPCILEIEKTNNVWTWRNEYVNSDFDMVFSDIMTMRDSITLLAQYSCANNNLPGTNGYDNNHQVFLLDRYDLGGCYNMNHTISFSSMVRYSMIPSEGYYFHYDEAPMRLYHINDLNSQFGVAFGVEEADGSSGGIRLFAFQNAWQYYRSLYYQIGRLAVVKEIGNLYKSDSLHVLSQDNVHTNGMVGVLSLSAVSHDVTWLTKNGYAYNSLTQKFTGDHIDISGHDELFGFHLFDQDVHNLSLESCFNKEIHEYEVLPEHRGERHDVKWEFQDMRVRVWSIAEIFYPQISTSTECEKCN